MTIGAHMIVRGLVQGVGFRWFVARHAQALGLHGFVRNLPDGNVEVEAVGERGLIEELLRHVKVGPRSAHVSDVMLEWLDTPELAKRYTQFLIR
jgi:acylphosphatase